MSTRVNAIQKFDYKVQRQRQPKHELVLQTYSYYLDYNYYALENDPGQKCVFDLGCLEDVDIFKYEISFDRNERPD
jgi:hypothetical protein